MRASDRKMSRRSIPFALERTHTLPRRYSATTRIGESRKDATFNRLRRAHHARRCTRARPNTPMANGVDAIGRRTPFIDDGRRYITRHTDGCAACPPHRRTYASPPGERAKRYPTKAGRLRYRDGIRGSAVELCARTERHTTLNGQRGSARHTLVSQNDGQSIRTIFILARSTNSSSTYTAGYSDLAHHLPRLCTAQKSRLRDPLGHFSFFQLY